MALNKANASIQAVVKALKLEIIELEDTCNDEVIVRGHKDELHRCVLLNFGVKMHAVRISPSRCGYFSVLLY